MVEKFRILVGCVCLGMFIWVAALNWSVVWQGVRKPEGYVPSWIPIVGGLLGYIGIAYLPSEELHSYRLLPFLLDWGCIPGFLHTAYFWIGRWRRGKSNHEP